MELLKHIVLFFISPLNLAISLFAMGMLLSRRKPYFGKTFKLMSLATFFLFSQPYVSDLLLYPLEHKHHYPNTQSDGDKPDYILVLACYYSTFGNVPDTSRWTECSLQRNIEALKLHRKSGAPILITGGNFLHDSNVNYSEKAREFFEELGVSKDKIIITKLGTDTEEEVLSALPYIAGAKTWVVSSATHIYRLENLFSFYNCVGEFFPVNHHSKGLLTPYLAFPSASALSKSELAFYEYLALMKQKLISNTVNQYYAQSLCNLMLKLCQTEQKVSDIASSMVKSKKQTLLEKLGTIVGEKSKIGKLISGYRKLEEANYISSHFSAYLAPVVASSKELKNDVFTIRHEVYCEELGFEPIKESGLEFDEFDSFSLHCLIQHHKSKHFAGTVRMVRPMEPDEQLPIEKYCLNSITRKDLDPSQFDRRDICEISRLAVPKEFRRRVMDKFAGAGVAVINEHTYSEKEVRCFPFIAVGLYLAAAALAIEEDIKHAYVMMEPRLARSMKFIGIKFEQIGPVVEYHGKRAPYYINQNLLRKSLRPGFAKMLADILDSIEKQDF